jgi:hypothetical protein
MTEELRPPGHITDHMSILQPISLPLLTAPAMGLAVTKGLVMNRFSEITYS